RLRGSQGSGGDARPPAAAHPCPAGTARRALGALSDRSQLVPLARGEPGELMQTQVLHRGEMSGIDFRCDAEGGGPAFTEVHASHALSYVRSGSFGYEVAGTTHQLVTGSLLVSRPDQAYRCTHPHAPRDECLAFELSPALVEALGGSDAAWQTAVLPPLA